MFLKIGYLFLAAKSNLLIIFAHILKLFLQFSEEKCEQLVGHLSYILKIVGNKPRKNGVAALLYTE